MNVEEFQVEDIVAKIGDHRTYLISQWPSDQQWCELVLYSGEDRAIFNWDAFQCDKHDVYRDYVLVEREN